MEKENAKNRKADFYILLFFLVSCGGWLWEGGIYLVLEHTFINRGIFYGPYLPIYGVGGLLLWLSLQRFHDRKAVTFGLSAVLCSVLEYGTGVYLEWKWGLRWWDYSGWFLNVKGHICMLSALGFGLGGMLLNCYVMPYYMRLYHRIPGKWRRILCIVLLAVLTVDGICCTVCPHTGDYVSFKAIFNDF